MIMYMYIYIYTYTHVYILVMYVCIYIYIYIYTCIHTYMGRPGQRPAEWRGPLAATLCPLPCGCAFFLYTLWYYIVGWHVILYHSIVQY